MSIPSIPYLDALKGATEIVFSLEKALKDVKIYRRQAEDLGNRCVLLLNSYRDESSGLEDISKFSDAAEEVTAIIGKVNRKAQTWADMGLFRSLVNQSEIKEGIKALNREVETCATRFNTAMFAELLRRGRDSNQERERNEADFRDLVRMVLHEVEELKKGKHVARQDVENFAQTIQEELHEPIESTKDREMLQEGLFQIYKLENVLPPGNDLTGQVEKVSSFPVISGIDKDVYTGMWLGQYKVALKRYRTWNQTPIARTQFNHEVGLWRDLQHPHICRLFGIARFDNDIYSVSAWMENGDAFSYINGTIEVIDRIQLLRGVLSGMECLHSRGVVHGDLRAANILINKDGEACISDFGFSKVLEQVGQATLLNKRVEGAVRWHAPELVVKVNQFSPISPATDVWSFGMLCLEIMTGERPYAHRSDDRDVIRDLRSKQLPPRPTDKIVRDRGLSDNLWNTMLSCWHWDPKKRPDIQSLSSRVIRDPEDAQEIYIPVVDSPQPIRNDLPPIATQQPPRNEPIPINEASGLRASPHSRTVDSSSSSSSQTGPSSLFNLDGLDVRVVIRRDDEGHVLRGTLCGLVDELVAYETDSAERRSYLGIFLKSYNLFNPRSEPLRDVLRLLLRHHALAENMPPEKRAGIRHAVLNVLKELLSEQYGTVISLSLLEELRGFLRSITSPAPLAPTAWDLDNTIEQWIKRRHAKSRLSAGSLGGQTIRHSNVDPKMLALALKIVERKAYELITATDCVLHLAGKDRPSAVATALELHDKLKAWAKALIVRKDQVVQVVERGEALQLLINTASECRKLANFSSMTAILEATNSRAISGLQITRDRLKREVIDLEKELSTILNPANNYLAYKKLLTGTDHQCVPWIAVHVSDLEHILKEHEEEIIEDGRTLINFERYRALSRKIDEMLIYQPKPLNLDPNLLIGVTELVSYLEIRIASLDAQSTADLDAKADNLRDQELESIAERRDAMCRSGLGSLCR